MKEQNKTQKAILDAAKHEFLEKGFRGASLRNIVKTAKVTTGAFYGYYESKEQLFDALVKEPSEYIMNEFNRTQEEFKKLSPEKQNEEMGKVSGRSMIKWIDYILDNADAFKLILKCAEGTGYENYIHKMVETEIRATHDFVHLMNENGKSFKTADENLEHILISGMFSAYFEMALHDIPRDAAHIYVEQLNEFYVAGWAKIMGC